MLHTIRCINQATSFHERRLRSSLMLGPKKEWLIMLHEVLVKQR